MHPGDPPLRLGPGDLEPPSARCPVCDGAGARVAVALVQAEPRVDSLECLACGACSLSRMPTAAFLEAFYREAYAPQHVAITASNADRFALHLRRALPGLSAALGELSVLDFGGNDGSIAAAVARAFVASGRARSARVVVVDFVPPASVADAQLTLTGVKTLEEVGTGFDLVIASAVLEHFPALNPLLRGLLGRLRHGGQFYARTPYEVPLKRLFPHHRLNFPAHVHDLGPRFWRDCLHTFGVKGQLLTSRPAIVETTFRTNPVRTLAAHLLKFPARLEVLVGRRVPAWKLVGGWEVVLRRD